MGIRLTGLSTPVIGAEWEYIDKKNTVKETTPSLRIKSTLTSESVNHRKYMFMSCKERLMKYLLESYACKKEINTCILRLNKTQTELCPTEVDSM